MCQSQAMAGQRSVMYTVKLFECNPSNNVVFATLTYCGHSGAQRCLDYKKRSFSSMNRVCTKLRQRMTPDHLSQLLLISIEGPEVLSRRDIVNIVYIWYKKGNRRIQLPDRLQWLYFTWLFWAKTLLWLGSEVVKLWSVQLFYVGQTAWNCLLKSCTLVY